MQLPPENQLHAVWETLDTTPCDFIVDAGSNITILRPDIVDCGNLEETNRVTFLRTVNGDSVRVQGVKTVVLQEVIVPVRSKAVLNGKLVGELKGND